MHIHAYQIDNVLNVYRKQLSQKTRAKALNPAQAPSALDRVNLSHLSQRQSIMDQVSADIVERITKYAQENRFDEPLEQTAEELTAQGNDNSLRKGNEFSYTLIDENNDKQTNTFKFNVEGPLITKMEQRNQVIEDEP